MRIDILRDRSKDFALRMVRLFSALPKTAEAQLLGEQALRTGTLAAAHFRRVSRARSHAEFLAKLALIEQEFDETLLWLELLMESGLTNASELAALRDEAHEFLKITVTSIKCAKRRI